MIQPIGRSAFQRRGSTREVGDGMTLRPHASSAMACVMYRYTVFASTLNPAVSCA